MDLIIVESPTKAKTLSRFLGKDYHVEATLGHIKDLPKSKIGVDVEHDFAPDYVVVEKRAKEITAIKKAAKKAKKLYLATDPDREGEAISSHVKEVLTEGKDKLKADKFSRITFHEITKEAVEEAISHAGKIDYNLVDAQIARRVLDRLVGYKLSPVLWKKVRRGLSAGRVQTVAVRLIVEKEREIQKFKPEEYWEIWAEVAGKESKKPFIVRLFKIEGKSAKVENKSQADKILDDLRKIDYKVLSVKSKEVKKSPYPPFTTSTMTQSAANLFGWSSKKTMSVAQKLYEEGFITYHRTDSFNIAETALAKTRKYIEKEMGNEYVPETPRFYKTKSKSAQEAHEAIRPTEVAKYSDFQLPIASKFKNDAEKLYQLIWKRFVSCQMANAVYDATTIDTGDKKYLLRATGQVVKFPGWRRVYNFKSAEDVILPKLNEGDDLDLLKVDGEQKFTQPPARYNEASLIKMLESLGIGRPSTYAPTISTIQTRQYVEKEDKKFIPTQIGFAVCDFMMANFSDIFDYQFTAEMEDDLDHVADGKTDWKKMMKKFYSPFEKKVKHVEKEAKRVAIPTESLGRKCPTCKKEGREGDEQGELVIRTGRFGKFISCSKFPDCKHTEKYMEKIHMKCPDCKTGDVIVKKTKKGRVFFGCSRYPECEYASWTDPSKKKEEKD